MTGTSEFDNWKVADFIALQQQYQKALENPKPGEVLPLFAKMVATMKAVPFGTFPSAI